MRIHTILACLGLSSITNAQGNQSDWGVLRSGAIAEMAISDVQSMGLLIQNKKNITVLVESISFKWWPTAGAPKKVVSIRGDSACRKISSTSVARIGGLLQVTISINPAQAIGMVLHTAYVVNGTEVEDPAVTMTASTFGGSAQWSITRKGGQTLSSEGERHSQERVYGWVKSEDEW